ncbi:MAG: dihydropteroate synthase [Microthrixaceae bacterium]
MILELGPDHRYDITHRALVMGILNRTPDSFFDGGQYFDFDGFLAKAAALVEAGADFLDVGGVKAGPGPEVGTEEELERVVPAVAALRDRFDVPISVDTWNPVVLRASLEAGGAVGNDISGFADPEYLPICAEFGASVVATHIRLGPRIADPEPVYDDLCADVRGFLHDRARMALDAGIPSARIMVDDGLDLGKTEPQSLELLRTSDQLAALGYAAFLSASNKRFLGELLDLEVGDRREASHAAHVLGITLGCRVLRAHDVRGARRTADIVAELLERQARQAGQVRC